MPSIRFLLTCSVSWHIARGAILPQVPSMNPANPRENANKDVTSNCDSSGALSLDPNNQVPTTAVTIASSDAPTSTLPSVTSALSSSSEALATSTSKTPTSSSHSSSEASSTAPTSTLTSTSIPVESSTSPTSSSSHKSHLAPPTSLIPETTLTSVVSSSSPSSVISPSAAASSLTSSTLTSSSLHSSSLTSSSLRPSSLTSTLLTSSSLTLSSKTSSSPAPAPPSPSSEDNGAEKTTANQRGQVSHTSQLPFKSSSIPTVSSTRSSTSPSLRPPSKTSTSQNLLSTTPSSSNPSSTAPSALTSEKDKSGPTSTKSPPPPLGLPDVTLPVIPPLKSNTVPSDTATTSRRDDAEKTSTGLQLPGGLPDLTDLPTDLPRLTSLTLPIGLTLPTDSPLPTDLPSGLPISLDVPFPTGLPSILPTSIGIPFTTGLPHILPSSIDIPFTSDLPLGLPSGLPSGLPISTDVPLPTGLPSGLPISIDLPLGPGLALPTSLQPTTGQPVPTASGSEDVSSATSTPSQSRSLGLPTQPIPDAVNVLESALSTFNPASATGVSATGTSDAPAATGIASGTSSSSPSVSSTFGVGAASLVNTTTSVTAPIASGVSSDISTPSTVPVTSTVSLVPSGASGISSATSIADGASAIATTAPSAISSASGATAPAALDSSTSASLAASGASDNPVAPSSTAPGASNASDRPTSAAVGAATVTSASGDSGISITPLSSSLGASGVSINPVSATQTSSPESSDAAANGADGSQGSGGETGSPTGSGPPSSTSTEPAAPPATGGLSKSGQIGVGVGVGVSSAALVAVAAVMFAAQRHRRGNNGQEEDGDSSEKNNFFGPDGTAKRSILGAGYSKFSGNDSLPAQTGPMKPATTGYESGNFAISSPIPGSFRQNIILGSPLAPRGGAHSPLAQHAPEDEAYQGEQPPTHRSESAMQGRARNLLTGLGIGAGQGQALLDEEAGAGGRGHTEAYQPYDPHVAELSATPETRAVPVPPPFSPKRPPLRRPDSAAQVRNTPSPAAGSNAPLSEALAAPAKERRSVPQLRLDTAPRTAHAFAAPAPKPLGVGPSAPPRLGAVPRNSVTESTTPSFCVDAEGMSSRATSIISMRDDIMMHKGPNPHSAARQSSGIFEPEWTKRVAPTSDPASDKTSREASQPEPYILPATAFSALRRSKALRRTSSNLGSQRHSRAPSTVYSFVDDERRSGQNFTADNDQSPLMSPEDVERNVADFRELARGRSLRSCNP